MIEVGILKTWDSVNYKAGVQLAGSLTAYFDEVKTARNIASSAMVVGNYVLVAMPEDNPEDACVIASWPSGNANADDIATHAGLTTGVHGVGARHIAETSVANLDLAAHHTRHEFTGDDAIALTPANLFQALSTGVRFIYSCLETYDNWEAYAHGSGTTPQDFAIASCRTGTTAGSCARQNLNWAGLSLNYNGTKLNIRGLGHPNYGVEGNVLAFFGTAIDKFTETQNSSAYIGNHAGFFFENDKWYASTGDGAAQTKTEISIDGSGFFEIRRTAAGTEFYFDGVLKATHTTHQMSGSGYMQIFTHNKATTTNVSVYFYQFAYHSAN